MVIVDLLAVWDFISYKAEDYTIVYIENEQIVVKDDRWVLSVIDFSDYQFDREVIEKEMKDSIILDRLLQK
jgi:hypothetical protein